VIANILPLLLTIASLGANDAMSPERLEKMLSDGDTAWVIQTFRRHPEGVLAFVDQYLEGGLKIIEKGGDAAKATASFRRGLSFAEAADDAFKEVLFTEYAANFGSWSREEQKRFRQGQAEYGKGRKAKEDDPATALAHFKSSLSLAKPLGDKWGMAVAYMQIAETQSTLGEYEAAKSAAIKAAELSSRLRWRIPHVRARLICGQSHSHLGAPAAGRGHLRIAWETLNESDKKELRAQVLDAYCKSLEAAGNKDLAAKLRADHADLFETE
jgi:tetratricopeptide (TPR) repeat protein